MDAINGHECRPPLYRMEALFSQYEKLKPHIYLLHISNPSIHRWIMNPFFHSDPS